MASLPGRWQQCLDFHGGHLQDVLLKMWGFFCESNTVTYLTMFSCIYCCVQWMCYPTFKTGNVKCHTMYILIYTVTDTPMGMFHINCYQVFSLTCHCNATRPCWTVVLL
jgi:hypothetical protein